MAVAVVAVVAVAALFAVVAVTVASAGAALLLLVDLMSRHELWSQGYFLTAVVRLLLCPKTVGHNHCKTTVITNWFINNCCC